ncbi:DNA binding,ATP binding [Balamuthia mandrillaris]
MEHLPQERQQQQQQHRAAALIDRGRAKDDSVSPQERLIREIRGDFAMSKPGTRTLHSFQNSLAMLADQLYSREHHFVLELLQNAEDNRYPDGARPELGLCLMSCASFFQAEEGDEGGEDEEEENVVNRERHEGVFLLLNNEVGFDERDVNAICMVGDSTKAQKKALGYIGEKGIGFKSVFKVTDHPHIFSNGYRIRFAKEPDPEFGISYVVPTWVDRVPKRIQRLMNGKTVMALPIPKVTNTSSNHHTTIEASPYQRVAEHLQHISPEIILFLPKLERFTISVETIESSSTLSVSPFSSPASSASSFSSSSRTLLLVDKDTSQFPLICLSFCREGCKQQQNESHDNKNETYFWVNHKTFFVPNDVYEPKRENVQQRLVSVALPLFSTTHKKQEAKEETTKTREGKVFAFLPTSQRSGLPFHVNADFILIASREFPMSDNRWNDWSMRCIAPTFVEAFCSLLQHPEHRFKAYRFIPTAATTEKAYQKVTDLIHQQLKTVKCVILRTHSSSSSSSSSSASCLTSSSSSPPLSPSFALPKDAKLGCADLYRLVAEASSSPIQQTEERRFLHFANLVHPTVYMDETATEGLKAIGVQGVDNASLLNDFLLEERNEIVLHQLKKDDPKWFGQLYEYLARIGFSVSSFASASDATRQRQILQQKLIPTEASSFGDEEQPQVYFQPERDSPLWQYLKERERKLPLTILHSSVKLTLQTKRWLSDNFGLKELSWHRFVREILFSHQQQLSTNKNLFSLHPKVILQDTRFFCKHQSKFKKPAVIKLLEEGLLLLPEYTLLHKPTTKRKASSSSETLTIVLPASLCLKDWGPIFCYPGKQGHFLQLSNKYVKMMEEEAEKREIKKFFVEVLGVSEVPPPPGPEASFQDWYPKSVPLDVLLWWLEKVHRQISRTGSFYQRLTQTSWLPSTKGPMPPKQVFLRVPSVTELFGEDDVPFLDISGQQNGDVQLSSELIDFLQVNRSADVDILLEQLQPNKKNQNKERKGSSLEFLSKVYIQLHARATTSQASKEKIVEAFRQTPLLFTGIEWMTLSSPPPSSTSSCSSSASAPSPSPIFWEDCPLVFDSDERQHIYLSRTWKKSNRDDELLRQFFVQTLGIEERVGVDALLDRLAELSRRHCQEFELIRRTYEEIHKRLTDDTAKTKFKAFLNQHPALILVTRPRIAWVRSTECIWEDMSEACLDEFYYLCKTWTITGTSLKEFLTSHMGVKYVASVDDLVFIHSKYIGAKNTSTKRMESLYSALNEALSALPKNSQRKAECMSITSIWGGHDWVPLSNCVWDDNMADIFPDERYCYLCRVYNNKKDLQAFFIQWLGIQKQLGLKNVVEFLTGLQNAEVTIEQTASIYTALSKLATSQDAISFLKQAFQSQPLLFVPSFTDRYDKTWTTSLNCVWQDVSRDFLDELACLSKYYPKDLKPFFTNVLAVKEEPDVAIILRIWKNLCSSSFFSSSFSTSSFSPASSPVSTRNSPSAASFSSFKRRNYIETILSKGIFPSLLHLCSKARDSHLHLKELKEAINSSSSPAPQIQMWTVERKWRPLHQVYWTRDPTLLSLFEDFAPSTSSPSSPCPSPSSSSSVPQEIYGLDFGLAWKHPEESMDEFSRLCFSLLGLRDLASVIRKAPCFHAAEDDEEEEEEEEEINRRPRYLTEMLKIRFCTFLWNNDKQTYLRLKENGGLSSFLKTREEQVPHLSIHYSHQERVLRDIPSSMFLHYNSPKHEESRKKEGAVAGPNLLSHLPVLYLSKAIESDVDEFASEMTTFVQSLLLSSSRQFSSLSSSSSSLTTLPTINDWEHYFARYAGTREDLQFTNNSTTRTKAYNLKMNCSISLEEAKWILEEGEMKDQMQVMTKEDTEAEEDAIVIGFKYRREVDRCPLPLTTTLAAKPKKMERRRRSNTRKKNRRSRSQSIYAEKEQANEKENEEENEEEVFASVISLQTSTGQQLEVNLDSEQLKKLMLELLDDVDDMDFLAEVVKQKRKEKERRLLQMRMHRGSTLSSPTVTAPPKKEEDKKRRSINNNEKEKEETAKVQQEKEEKEEKGKEKALPNEQIKHRGGEEKPEEEEEETEQEREKGRTVVPVVDSVVLPSDPLSSAIIQPFIIQPSIITWRTVQSHLHRSNNLFPSSSSASSSRPVIHLSFRSLGRLVEESVLERFHSYDRPSFVYNRSSSALAYMRECEERDAVIKEYIRSWQWSNSRRFNLLRKLVLQPSLLLGSFSNNVLLYEFDWEIPYYCNQEDSDNNDDRADLICCNGEDGLDFLIVVIIARSEEDEERAPNKPSKRIRRDEKLAKARMRYYCKVFRDSHPWARSIHAVTYSESDGVIDRMRLRGLHETSRTPRTRKEKEKETEGEEDEEREENDE